MIVEREICSGSVGDVRSKRSVLLGKDSRSIVYVALL